jgi:D-alanine-D-alanine ligase
MRVIVLHGALPDAAGKDDRDTLVQAACIGEVLRAMGYDVQTVPLSLDTGEALRTIRDVRPAWVFNLCESVAGRGSLIHLAPSLLDALGIPYTGAGTDAVFSTSQKLIAKKILRGGGVATPPWHDAEDPEQTAVPPGVYLIKSIWEHASVGLDEDAVVRETGGGEVRTAMARRRGAPGFPHFAEAFIEGREFNLSLLVGTDGPEVLPPAEIVFRDYPAGKPRIVCYRAKWEEDSFEYGATPRSFDFPASDAALLADLSGLAQRCWSLFGLKGYGRVDFRVDRDGIPWVLEVNTNPCLSPEAGFCAAAERAGLSFGQVIQRIVDEAL